LRQVKKLLKPTFAFASIGTLLWLVDWRNSIELLARVEPASIALVCTASVFGIVVSAWKWQQLLSTLSIHAGLATLVRIYWIGAFISSFLPSNIGGDVARAVLLRHLGSLSVVGASIIVERFTGLALVLLVAFGALLVRPDILAYEPLWRMVVLALGGGSVALLALTLALLVRAHRASARPMAADDGGWAGNIRTLLRKLEISLASYARQPGALVVACAASGIFYALHLLFHAGTFHALGLQVSLGDIAVVMPLVTLISALPISLNGLGISEGAFVFLYAQAGLSPEQALAAALIRRLVLTLTSLVGGLMWAACPPGRPVSTETDTV
jgi:glycosyltransferase 2 family protein